MFICLVFFEDIFSASWRHTLVIIIWIDHPSPPGPHPWPAHEIMALFVLRKLILQTCMRSQLVELHVWFLVGPFVYLHISCVRTSKDPARLHGRAGSHEPSLVAYVISTIISWAGSNLVFGFLYYHFLLWSYWLHSREPTSHAHNLTFQKIFLG